ncbi:adenosylcobinamide-GDP ribazoletransferase [Photobacterium damselae]|uniref:Adenosylcobinamide-GDP ribazoletransferase n=1 Tax=Photobacterium damselae TaxID=38293 RepID=A0ACD3SWU1_PHODM|nr:adenosylcobinamide-GDP ribazoletransferase [Photobacterium damselae]RDL34020.1 adenosylcobinamide-GDP ribazoletransferase [Photobacterium damselae]TMX46065.1 adenosylcobinamide-GDP ribazoletransferase [Photobacterium damselae]TMX62506.1 adenosylcobinamide-GDP ribazoletransferase [Photobacterium damselae]TMX71721.1 adenosylcobinamide-GDP ribazoletransferase [Photobacterium damselae]
MKFPFNREQIRYQWQLFLIALSFFTRIPVPQNTPFTEQRLNQANRYFGLVGCLVGLLSALSYLVFAAILPVSIAIGFAMITSMLITGAFHEDGLADVFDGFGGGWTVEKKLSIMKDSRVGTYGLCSLIMMLGLKWLTLTYLAQDSVWLPAYALFVMHGVSRVVAASLIFSYPYVRADQTSKVKPLAKQQSPFELWVLIGTGLVLVSIFPISLAISLIAAMVIVRFAASAWFQQQLGGYTGDCLGACQQIAELIGYCVILAFYHHILG